MKGNENKLLRLVAVLSAVIIGVVIGFIWSPWENNETGSPAHRMGEKWIELKEEKARTAAQV